MQREATFLFDAFHLGKSQRPFNLMSVSVQRSVLLSLASFLRAHAIQYHSIARRLAQTDEALGVPYAMLLAEFRDLMEAGASYLKKLGDSRLAFLLYAIAFERDPSLCPYFLFFSEWLPQEPRVIAFETPHPVAEPQTWFHFSRDPSFAYRVCVSTPDGHFSPGTELRFVHPTAPHLDAVMRAPGEFLLHHPTEIWIRLVVAPGNDLATVWGVKVTFTAVGDGKPCCSGESYRMFIREMEVMLAEWRPEHDALFVPHVKEPDVFEFLSPQALIKLNRFSRGLAQMRFSFLKKLNELFPTDLNRLPVGDVGQPLVALELSTSHGLSPALKLRRLEKLVCRNYNEKKLYRFNRSRALIARADPDAPNGRSLFDQVVDQIPLAQIPSLKCNDAPWRVSLEGEGATDAGGPGRDLFSEVSSEICMAHNHLFVPSATGDFVPDLTCKILSRFVYVGAFVALAFITRLQQPYRFATMVWAFLAGQKIIPDHIFEIDPEFRTWLANAEKAVAHGEVRFTVPSFSGEQVELFAGGANLIVSQADTARFAGLAMQFRIAEFLPSLRRMREGFSIFLGEISSLLVTAEELRSFICGSVDIPMAELEQLIQIVEGSPDEQAMLYQVLDEFSVEERMLFIKFATGKMSVPAPGAGWNGCLNVVFIPLQSPPYMLPLAATCSSTVTIPSYPTKEILAEKLRAAITYGGEIVLDHDFDAGGILQ
jgi:hypothetical protein